MLNIKPILYRSTADKPVLFAIFLTVLYILFFSFLSIQKYRAYNCDLDLGNILQAFYNTLDGRFMQTTWSGSDVNSCRWGGHTEFIFALLIPLFTLFRHPYTLLLAQTIVIGFAGLAVFYLANKRTNDSPTALVLALAFCLFFFKQKTAYEILA